MKDKLNIHTSCKSSEWETPHDLFEAYNTRFHFNVDVAATHDNALLEKYWTIQDDALSKDWAPMVCWMNPPYGREIAKFMSKAWHESQRGATVVCLVPSRTDTAWWHEYAMKGEVEFIRGRLRFVNRTFPSWRSDGNFKISPACFPSAVVIFKSNAGHEARQQQKQEGGPQ